MTVRPNILLAIADDLAWPHLSAYGCRFVRTPVFDRVAATGVLFDRCFTTAPTCTASRASLLTGKYPWQLEEGCQLWGLLPAKYPVYPDLLEAAGYWIGHTYKGWGPGSVEAGGRSRNPAGPAFNRYSCEPLTANMAKNDYPANFRDFLEQKPSGAPFCFWYGAKEPHRDYEPGSGLRHGKRLEDVEVPSYLPDCPEVRSDFLDYALEIERFDHDLGVMLDLLEERGELDNTIVIVTGDNGNPFPRAKATVYQHGCHVPLAIGWKAQVPGGRLVTDFISFVDLAPTLLEAAGVDAADCDFTGRSFLDLLRSDRGGRVDATRNLLLTGRERHAYSRHHNTGYPGRALVTDDWLYIRNFAPERMPGGDPSTYGDVDDSPSKSYILAHRDEPGTRSCFELCFGKRPAEELYRVADDPDCVVNLAGRPEYAAALAELRPQLETRLRQHCDPRMTGRGWIFDCFPYFGDGGRFGYKFADGAFPAMNPRFYQRRHLPEGRKEESFNATPEFMKWMD